MCIRVSLKHLRLLAILLEEDVDLGDESDTHGFVGACKYVHAGLARDRHGDRYRTCRVTLVPHPCPFWSFIDHLFFLVRPLFAHFSPLPHIPSTSRMGDVPGRVIFGWTSVPASVVGGWMICVSSGTWRRITASSSGWVGRSRKPFFRLTSLFG